jgi:hypothetical protein
MSAFLKPFDFNFNLCTATPREGRLVLHGWFNDPSPVFAGALTEEAAEPTLNRVLPPLYASLAVGAKGRGRGERRTHNCTCGSAA